MRFKGKFQEALPAKTGGRLYPYTDSSGLLVNPREPLEKAMTLQSKKEDKNWPPKWVDVYPHGTKEGDEEFEFFRILARDPKWEYRSVSSISKDTGLSKERVEEIIQKYYKKGMLFQKPGNEDFWGYWERVPDMVPSKIKSIGKTDKDQRVNKLLNKDSFSMVEKDEDDKLEKLREVFDICKSDNGFQMIEIKSTPSDTPNFYQEMMAANKVFREDLEAQWEEQGFFSTLISQATLPEDMRGLVADIIIPIEDPFMPNVTIISMDSNNEFAWDDSFNLNVGPKENLGEIDDMLYFQKKMLEGMSFPQEEWTLDL